MIYIRYTISKISFSYIMYITIILCRNYLQIVKSNYVYFGQINESLCLSVLCEMLLRLSPVITRKCSIAAESHIRSHYHISSKIQLFW